MTRQAKDALTKAQNLYQNGQTQDAVAATVAELLIRYSFDLAGYDPARWIEQWSQYPLLWLRSAVIEALYQGRYKAVSVWQILDLWQRRGQPLQHFNREFERMVVGRTFQLLFPTEPEPAYSPDLLPDLPPSLIAVPTSTGWQATNGAMNGTTNGDTNGDMTNGYATNGYTNDYVSQAELQLMYTESVAPTWAEQEVEQGFEQEVDQNELGAAADYPEPPVIQTFRPTTGQITLPKIASIRQQRPRAFTPPPIQRFIPHLEGSEFHDKLKSIAHTLTLANAHTPILGVGGPSMPQPDPIQGRPQPEPSRNDSDDLEDHL
jgi:hypothetical protein